MHHRDQREKVNLDHLVPIFDVNFSAPLLCTRKSTVHRQPWRQHYTVAAVAEKRETLLLRRLLTIAGRGKAGGKESGFKSDFNSV